MTRQIPPAVARVLGATNPPFAVRLRSHKIIESLGVVERPQGVFVIAVATLFPVGEEVFVDLADQERLFAHALALLEELRRLASGGGAVSREEAFALAHAVAWAETALAFEQLDEERLLTSVERRCGPALAQVLALFLAARTAPHGVSEPDFDPPSRPMVNGWRISFESTLSEARRVVTDARLAELRSVESELAAAREEARAAAFARSAIADARGPAHPEYARANALWWEKTIACERLSAQVGATSDRLRFGQAELVAARRLELYGSAIATGPEAA